MTFEASDTKGRQFLDFLNDNLKSIEHLYFKEKLWLKFFGYSNSSYTKVSRAIINYVPTREYQLRFFLQKNLSILVDNIQSKQDNIFFMNVESLTITGIQDRIH